LAKFTIDTHIFRELGELLVGRDSTALIELVKNAYDADATEVEVYGEMLDDINKGFIVIKDNGTGMAPEDFERGFLRIATRVKEEGARRSKKLQRRFTGEKGIGRLAAHKLASVLEVLSFPAPDNGLRKTYGVEARIDWENVEQADTLDELEGTSAIAVTPVIIQPGDNSGTTITLRRLRRPWSGRERGRFLEEIQTFQPPEILTRPLPVGVVGGPLLFETPMICDQPDQEKAFEVKLEGNFESGDSYWTQLMETASWLLEIEAREGQEVRYCIAPTAQALKDIPGAERRSFSVQHPAPDTGPFFQARILLREGRAGGAQKVRHWVRSRSGISVYMEGFRVLPYGEPGNDWLSLDYDYTRRNRELKLMPDLPSDGIDSDEGLMHLPNRSYFGAVFLTQQAASSLRLLINREGFVPTAGFTHLSDLIRTGIDLTTRTRAAARMNMRVERKLRRSNEAVSESSQRGVETSSAEPRAKMAAERLGNSAREARELLAKGDITLARVAVDQVISEAKTIVDESEVLISERAMLHVLASVGTQAASFVHEINALVGMVQTFDGAMAHLREEATLTPVQRHKLAQLHSLVGDIRRGLERLASYLLDVTAADARRRRSRQSLSDRFEASRKLIAHAADRRSVTIINSIPVDLKSPPMFPAELVAVFSNLLTNAIKAAGTGGAIRAFGESGEQGAIVTVENTGVSVNVAESERWFRPFESTTSEVDAILGQGMGLGLTITRNILEEYGCEIRFVRPSEGYQTALEIKFSG
jgi:signal transduction histidine kinase